MPNGGIPYLTKTGTRNKKRTLNVRFASFLTLGRGRPPSSDPVSEGPISSVGTCFLRGLKTWHIKS